MPREKFDPDIADAPPAPTPSERVESWKEIAAYLQRDVRTVQRWEKSEALPVYRHMHEERGTVYAYKAELDAWWNNRRPRLELQEQAPPVLRRRRLLWLVAAGITLAAGVGIYRGSSLRPWAGNGRPVLQQIAVLDLPYAKLSPDGKWLAYVEGRSQYLHLRNILTGEDHTLIAHAVYPYFAWSPEGRRIAFVPVTAKEPWQLEAIDTSTGDRRVLWRGGEPVPKPLNWSGDGSKLLVQLVSPTAGGRTLAVLTLPGGPMTPLVSGIEDADACLSPDGAWVVYRAIREGNSDIFVLSLAGGKETSVAGHPATDSDPFFSADGKWIVFWSDRRGWGDFWAVPFRNGQVSGQPQLVYANIGNPYFASISNDNTVLLTGWRRAGKVDLIAVDTQTGTPLASAANTPSFADDTFSPFWGRTSTELFYLTRHGGRQPMRVMRKDLRSGTESEILPPPLVPYLNRASLSTDGETLLFFGEDSEGQAGIFTYSLKTQKLVALIRDPRLPWNAATDWSPDGKKVAFSIEEADGKFTVRVLELRTGKQWAVAVSRVVPSPRWSPDGSVIAYYDEDRLLSVPWQGGKPREVLRLPVGQHSLPGQISVEKGRMTWSPDGKKLACIVNNSSTKRMELWVVDYPGGTHRSILTGEVNYGPYPRDLAWSPDGKYIAFSWRPKQEYEILALSNFLPRSVPGN